MTAPSALVLGCGYVGLRVAEQFVGAGFSVVGTTRTEQRFEEIEATGARPLLVDTEHDESIDAAAKVTTDIVVDTVRPRSLGADRYDAEPTRRIARAFSGRVRLAYLHLSATSVYGRRAGAWTDEESPCRPTSPLGRVRLQMEAHLIDLARSGALPVRICRVPGIYGPGRTLRSRLVSGSYRPIAGIDPWVSRIHVDDLAAAIVAAATRGQVGRIYLMADDRPTRASEYAACTAEALSLTVPDPAPLDALEGTLSRSALERRLGSRRCRNARMKAELGARLRYPSIFTGVPAALAAEDAP